MNDLQEQAMRDFEATSKKVKSSLGMKQGGEAAETAYSEAYQRGVRSGLFQQIKKRYR